MNPQKQKQTQLKTQDTVFLKLKQAQKQALESKEWINIPLAETSEDGAIMRMQLAISPSGVAMLQISTARITNKINIPSSRHLKALVRLLNIFYNEFSEEKRKAIEEFLNENQKRKGTRIFEL